MSAHHCPNCERVFESARGLQVHHWRAYSEVLPRYRCEYCHGYFNSEYKRKYCSTECRRQIALDRSDRERAVCTLCNTAFEYYPSEKQGLYCSDCVENEPWRTTPIVTDADNPQWTGGKRTVACAVCEATVERWPSEIKSVTVCSEDCRQQWLSETFTGEGHPNWKGGGNEAYGKGWAAVRKQALERDGHQCRTCGRTRTEIGRNPDVHHIRSVRSFIDSDTEDKTDAHRLDNVISLCISCHRKADFGKISKARLRSLVHSPVPADK